MQNLKKHVNFIMAREVFLGIFLKTEIFYFYLVFVGFEEKYEMSLRPDVGKLVVEVYQMFFIVRFVDSIQWP